ncbi:MAG: hypothetical protein FWH07_02195 [Oscillospiraceae bacterium]|nr:hypothetical protein [Oscillospiraceae bacterium]
MARKLTAIYESAKKAGGLSATMRMAMLTGMASQQAADAPDSPENLAKFAKAYKEVTGKSCPIS